VPLSAVTVATRPGWREMSSMQRVAHAAAVCRSSLPMSTNPVFRSTIVTAVWVAWESPLIVSISQCPLTARPSTSAGRSEMWRLPARRPRES